MTQPDRKFEEEIRRALCAASDLIVPAGDGLNKIRERTARRPAVLGWFLAYAAHLPRQLVRGGRVAASEAAATARGYSSLGLVLASARRWPGQARHALRTPGVWLRPVLAAATALLLVVGVTLSIPRLRQQMTAQLDSAFGSSSGQGSGGGAGGGAGGGGAQSSSATPIGSWMATHMPGKPFLATMPPGGAQCRGQGSGGTSGTVVAGTNTAAVNAAGTADPNATSSGNVGPEPVSDTCSPSTGPTQQLTSPPATALATTTPVTSPPTSPVITPPPTTPIEATTPPPTTSPATTPPTSTPPSTTSPPTTSTSSADNTSSAEAPTQPTPGG